MDFEVAYYRTYKGVPIWEELLGGEETFTNDTEALSEKVLIVRFSPTT